MRKISFSLNESSINNAIAQLEGIEKRLDGECKQLALNLAKYGYYIARVGFTNAVYEGKNDVKVSVEELPGAYLIKAEGEAVCFIEFGTGVGATSPHGGEYGFTPGSWSETHAKQFSEHGYWFYGGKYLKGTPSNNCMYNAEKEVRQEIKTFAKGVFG